ncbi:MAG: precorrin-8X methylmutase [Methanomicrobiales archaeon]
MSEESLPPAGTTGSTSIEIGAETVQAQEIARMSRQIARRYIGDAGPEDRIRQRCAVAVGDLAMADLLRFCHAPVPAGCAAIRSGAPVITDIRMVQTGILKKGHTCEIVCALDHGADIARRDGITRTAAGFQSLADRLTGAVVVIGNAPSALITVCDLIHRGATPALVVGTPVGFVNAAESKDLLRTVAVPSISTAGTRGGTPVAVAAVNELITMIAGERHAGPGD